MNALTCAALGTGFTFGMTALGAAVVFLISPQRRAPSARAQRVCLGFAAAGSPGASPCACALSMAGMSSDQTLAAIITPEAKPSSSFCIQGRI